jgi:diaminopimelate decarboxylase
MELKNNNYTMQGLDLTRVANEFGTPVYVYDAYHDILNISSTNGTKRVYTIIGNICETDTFGWDRHLHEVKEGDILAIKNAGADGYSMSSNYNSRFRPPEGLIINGKAKLIRQRETMDNLLNGQKELDF